MSKVLNLAELGLPDKHLEAWKYTPLARKLGQRQVHAGPPAALQVRPAACLFEGEAARIVFFDGQLQAELSDFECTRAATALPPQKGLESLEAAVAASSFDLAIHTDATPRIHLICAYSNETRISNLQLQLKVSGAAELQLVEEHVGGEQGLALVQLTTELAPGARVRHLRLQHAGATQVLLTTLQARIDTQASLHLTDIDWGAALSRTKVQLDLIGKESGVDYAALTGIADDQHVDHQVEARHASPHTTSRMHARGIVGGHARQVFNGRVLVERGAQKTDSDQILRNLLLSDKAEVDAKPELEIYADDVKCAHGSTVGRLDDAALFYLRSRGIDEQESRRLLMLSFAESILARIENPDLHSATSALLAEHLSLNA